MFSKAKTVISKIIVVITVVFIATASYGAKKTNTVNFNSAAKKYFTAIQNRDLINILYMDQAFVNEISQLERSLPKFKFTKEATRLTEQYATLLHNSPLQKLFPKSCSWKIIEIKDGAIYVSLNYKDSSEAPNDNNGIIKKSIAVFHINDNGLMFGNILPEKKFNEYILAEETSYWEISTKSGLSKAHIKLCDEYGVDITNYIVFNNETKVSINQNGKRIPLSDKNEITLVESAEFVSHPLNNKIRIRLDEFNVINNQYYLPVFITKYTVDDGKNITRKVALNYAGVAFNVKVGNCYFHQSAYGKTEGDDLSTITIEGEEPREYHLKTGQELVFEDGSKLKIVEVTAEVSELVPGYHGLAARIEYTSTNGNAKVFVAFKEHPDIKPNDIPIKIHLTEYKTSSVLYSNLQGYCD
jgi:hypothetical protein